MTKRADAIAAATDIEKRIAVALWHRFGTSSVIEWDDETHQADYIDAAIEVVHIASGLFSRKYTNIFRALILADWFEGITPQAPLERTFALSASDKAMIATALRALSTVSPANEKTP